VSTLAVANGVAITDAQVTEAAAAELAALEASRPPDDAAYARARLAILHRALEALVDGMLIQTEANARGCSIDDVFWAEIGSNIRVPSPEEVEQFYEADPGRFPLPRAEALVRIKQHLTDQSRRWLGDLFARGLRRTYPVTVYLEPLRTDVMTAGHPSRGPSDAPIVIVKFADFECGDCGPQMLDAIDRTYPGRVRVVFRQFPLRSIHRYSQKAAEASLCAHAQGRFWEYHDLLFARLRDAGVAGAAAVLGTEALRAHAARIGLDAAAFGASLDAGTYREAVERDLEEGKQAGVTGTPTIFINGRLLSGNQPYADLRKVVEDELRRIASAAARR
jgi:protein-disulfide isomerase